MYPFHGFPKWVTLIYFRHPGILASTIHWKLCEKNEFATAHLAFFITISQIFLREVQNFIFIFVARQTPGHKYAAYYRALYRNISEKQERNIEQSIFITATGNRTARGITVNLWPRRVDMTQMQLKQPSGEPQKLDLTWPKPAHQHKPRPIPRYIVLPFPSPNPHPPHWREAAKHGCLVLFLDSVGTSGFFVSN